VPARLHAHNDVVQHREALHQLEVLVDHADPQRVGIVGVADLDLLAVLLDGPLFRPVKAKQNAHQGGLSGTVFAQQSMDLALFQLERDVVVGYDARKPFGDVKHLNGILAVHA
jgi:hypothetical protein